MTNRAADLIAHLEHRAAILSASSAWGTDEDAMLMQQAADMLREDQARAWYSAVIQENEKRFAACDENPRLFVRMLREIEDGPLDDPLYRISEGRATELLAERERRAVDRDRQGRELVEKEEG